MELYSLRVFVTIVEFGSLSAAARHLNVTASALSQRLRGLEDTLKVRLLDRNTRRLQLTEEGELLYGRGSALLKDFESLQSDLRERGSQSVGSLRIHGPLGFGRRYLAPIVSEFQAAHPQLEIMLTLSENPVACSTERYDLIIHIGELAESNWIMYPIAPNRRLLCASPQYLAGRPPLAQPHELADHSCLALRENDEDATLWRFQRGNDVRRIRILPSLTTNDGDVLKQWALGGKGLMVRSEWDVALNLRAGHLVQVLEEWELPPADVVALVPHRKGMPGRLQKFLSFLQARFRPNPPWKS